METQPTKAQPPKRERRWLQFSLRTLLVSVAGVAIICGWYAAKLRRAADEDAVIAAAERIEGRVEVAYSGPDWLAFIYPRRLRRHVIGLSFDLSSDADLRPETVLLCLAGLRELQWLDLGFQPIDEEGLRCVGRMGQLSRLTSTSSSITELGAAQLARLPDLQELNLSGCHIDNAAIRKLADCPHLRKLMLRRAVAADELVDVGHLRGLSLLDLSGCDLPLSSRQDGTTKISNWLSGLDQLEELYLRDCPIQPGDIESISRLKNLRALDLTGSVVSASDLRWLLSLRKLKQLGFAPKSINDETIQVLHQLGQLELLSLNEGDFIRGNESSLPGFFETWLPMLKHAFPSITFDTGKLDYPGMRCSPGTRVVAVPDLIEDQEKPKSAGGGTF